MRALRGDRSTTARAPAACSTSTVARRRRTPGKSCVVRATATSVFVGREAELCVLRDAFGDASAGQPQVVIVEGEAGIGKTTLVERFVSDLPTSRLLKASGDESESHVPFAMADQLLRAQGSASDALGSGRHVAIGLELLELISSDPEDGPCVVFGDDAHLIDPESLRALLFAARRLVASRAVVVLVVRGTAEEALPQGWRKLASGSSGGVLSVGPLAPAHISALGTALGVDMTPEAAGRALGAHAGQPAARSGRLARAARGRRVAARAPDAAGAEVLRAARPRAPRSLSRPRRQPGRGGRGPRRARAGARGGRARLGRAPAGDARRRDRRPAWCAWTTAGRAGSSSSRTRWLAPRSTTALPTARRSALNAAAAQIVGDQAAAMRHRVEAATVVDAALLDDLEAHAHSEMSRGAWSSAVSSLIAASRLSPVRAERERLALEAIEATMYSGDGAAARRLADQAGFADGPRRDSVLAYLAMFAGDLEGAQRMLRRAWDRRALADDDRLSATIAQRSAFLATSRLRGREAIEWAERAMALAPEDPANGLLVAASLALGLSFTGKRYQAHAALDRWLDDPSAPPHGTGFVLLALKGFLLLGEGDLRGARAAFETSAAEGLERGLLVVAALSLSGLTRVQCLVGEWDSAVVSGERAHRARGRVRGSLGDRPGALVARATCRPLSATGRWPTPTCARSTRSRRRSSATSPPSRSRRPGLAAAQDRPGDVLRALEPLEQMQAGDGVGRPGVPAVAPPQGACAGRRRRAGGRRAVHRLCGGARGAAREPAAGHEARPRPRQARVRPSRSPSGRGRARGGAGDGRVDRRALRAGADRAHAGPGAQAGRRAARRGGHARRGPRALQRAWAPSPR